MNEPADLELSLHRRDASHYTIDMVYNQPGSEVDVRPLIKHTVELTIDEVRLRALTLDPDAYGRALGEMLLHDVDFAVAIAQTRATAQSQGRSLRLRLAISKDAPELHALRWETLRDPRDDLPVALSERVIFTRYLGSDDWQPVSLRAKRELRALVAIAAPRDLVDYKLAPIDVAAEQQRALIGLGAIPTTILAKPGEVTFNTIATTLRDGYDIFYLVAHGTIINGEPWLYLDNGDGAIACIDGNILASRLADLPTRPRLIVLASCKSAGDGTPKSLAALGPRLTVAGIPAVIAMQGDLSIETNTVFAPTFFRELQRDGRIDRALAVARQAIAGRQDWWVPTLFTRLRSGRIWYEPGFEEQDFQKWPALINSIARKKCTPILGPGLLEPLIGSTRDLARRLAEKHRFPLAPFARDDLPQVAQYLTVRQDLEFLRDELSTAFCEALAARTDSKVGAGDSDSADDMLAAAGAHRRATEECEPHHMLANLPFPIYLTANPDRLLNDALRAARKSPQVLICPWNRHGERSQTPIEPPTIERPLVYHLFGRLDDPESLVLTEDDYFRYLIGVTRNRDLLPNVVGSALTNTALLFLGFRLEDWNFRVLFQSVMNLEGYELRRRYAHVAVQIDPQEGAMLDPQAAREYLKTYFGPTTALTYNTNISIYWGSAEDFIRELEQHYTQLRSGM